MALICTKHWLELLMALLIAALQVLCTPATIMATLAQIEARHRSDISQDSRQEKHRSTLTSLFQGTDSVA